MHVLIAYLAVCVIIALVMETWAKQRGASPVEQLKIGILSMLLGPIVLILVLGVSNKHGN